MAIEKPCSKCRWVKPIGEFRFKDRRKQGRGIIRDSWCDECTRTDNRERSRQIAAARPARVAAFANPEQTRRLRNAKTGARERGAECETVYVKDWCAKLDHFEWRCAYCFGPYEQIEHVVAIADGGRHCLDNVVPSCAECNSGKNGGGAFVPHLASEFWPSLPEALYSSTVRVERLPRGALRAA